MTSARFVSVAEAAEMIGGGVSTDTVYDMIARGELPALDRGRGARKLIPREAIDRLAEACMAGWDATAAVDRLRARFLHAGRPNASDEGSA